MNRYVVHVLAPENRNHRLAASQETAVVYLVCELDAAIGIVSLSCT